MNTPQGNTYVPAPEDDASRVMKLKPEIFTPGYFDQSSPEDIIVQPDTNGLAKIFFENIESEKFAKGIEADVFRRTQSSVSELVRALQEIDTLQAIQNHLIIMDRLGNNMKRLQGYFFSLSHDVQRGILDQARKKYGIEGE